MREHWFDFCEKIDKLLTLEERNNRLLYEILHILRKHPKTHYASIRFGGNTMASTPGTQAVGSTLTATFVPLEADGVTVTPGATLTTQPQWTVDNTAIATIVANPDGTATITGVAAGSVNVTATGGVFTDSDGTATAPVTAANTDTVTQPTFRTVSAQINFA